MCSYSDQDFRVAPSSLGKKIFIWRWSVKGLPAFKEHDFSAEGSDSIHSQARVCTGVGLRACLRFGGCLAWTSFGEKRKGQELCLYQDLT